MKKKLVLLFLLFSINETSASVKENIVKNLETTQNLTFNFEQNINGKTENGMCALAYPKKVFCRYNLPNKKILVSDGQSVVVKTTSSYYSYPLDRTPLNLILDRNFLLNKINNLKERIIENKFVNFKFFESDFEVNIFFDGDNYNLIVWQTTDIYQNLSITFLSSIKKNQKLDDSLFILPKKN